jgi:predicted permease
MADRLRTLWSRARSLGRRGRLEDDLHDELAFHLAMREAQMRDAGAPDAPTGARRRFGNVAAIRAAMRDAWVTPWWQDVGRDVRFALRLLARDRGFTLAAVLTLGLGIGANTAMYSAVGSLPVRNLPFPDVERLVAVAAQDARGRIVGVSAADFDDWRAWVRSFDSLAAVYAGQSVNVADSSVAAERMRSGFVTANLFDTLGLQPALGRSFTAADDQPGAAAVALIAHEVWRTRYAEDPAVIGRDVLVNGRPATIVGVMPEGVQFPDNVAIWLPRAQVPADVDTGPRDARIFEVFGRLAEGVSVVQAQAELGTLSQQLAAAWPATNAGVTPALRPVGEQDLESLLAVALLQALVTCVLLIAAVNVAGLLLMRGARRATEMSVRASLGASRWRVVRQMLVESSVLAVAAGLVGLGLALAGARWLAALTGDVMEYGVAYARSMDWTVFAFLAASCLLTVAVGIAPAVLASRTDVNSVLKDGGGGATGSRRVRRWTGALVVAELAMTLALLAGAGLTTRSLLARSLVEVGVDTSPLVAMGISMVPPEYADTERRANVFRQLEQRLAAVPAIEASAMTTAVPFTFGQNRALVIDGSDAADAPRVTTLLVGDGYFDTVGIRMVRGRAFASDDGLPGRETVIVNQRFAEAYFADRDPLGARVRLDSAGTDSQTPWATIVGIAPDVRQLDSAPAQVPVAFLPHRTEWPRTGNLLLRARAGTDPATLVPLAHDALRDIDPGLAFFNVWRLDDLLADRGSDVRLFAAILGTFALLALGLSAIGLYGVTAYAVAQRTREFGLRMALGARPGQVRRLVVGTALRQLAIGLPLGLAGALAVGQILAGELTATRPADPVTLMAVVVLLAGVAMAASLVPASRAARLAPMTALRRD